MSIRPPRRSATSPRRRPHVAGQSAKARTSDDAPPADPVVATSPINEPRRDRTPRIPRRSWRWLAPLLAGTVAAMAFAAVATVERAGSDAKAADETAAQEAAASAAATAAEGILSYDHATVAEDLAAAQEKMTPAFAEEFAEVIPTVVSLAEQRQLVVKATVRNVAVVECGQECSTSTVRVLLFVDQERTGEGKTLSAIEVRTVLTMTRSKDAWLVSDSVSL